MSLSFKGAHFPQEIILTCVRWYVAYPLSTCNGLQTAAHGLANKSHFEPTILANMRGLLRTFGERQMMAQQIARRLLASPLINKEF